MTAGQPLILSTGLSDSLWQPVQPRVSAALSGLEMADSFGTISISADDLPGNGDTWYRILPGSVQQPGPVLALTCHADVFCRHRPLQTTTSLRREIWEQMEAPADVDLPDSADYSEERTDFFLHHHLLTIADLKAGRLVGDDVPAHLVEAVAAVWAVAVDGRLERRHLPGYPMAERRGVFSRLFSSAGILLPEHWQIFQSLWDGAIEGQTAILGVTRLLPRL